MTEPLTPERRREIVNRAGWVINRPKSSPAACLDLAIVTLSLLDALDAETERNARLEARIAKLEKSKEMLLQRLDYISRLSEGEEVER